jgi:membrane dipeptidase
VDTSHCGRQTTLDACQLSTAPVVATHTSAEGVYSHARAKSDEELKTLADTGGVIGVMVVPFMIAPSPAQGEKTGITAWLDHVDYIVNLVGWEHVAIGTDWPMQVPRSAMKDIVLNASLKLGHRKKDRIEDIFTGIDGFDEPCDFPNLTRGLISRGYSDEKIKGILGENFLRVFKEVCG